MTSPRDRLWQAVGYTPSIEQLAAHDDPARFKLIAGGVRAGKSYSASKELLWWIVKWGAKHSAKMDDKRHFDGESALWWIVGPTYELCRPEYLYIADDLQTVGLVKKNNISMARTGALSIRLPFGTIETKSAEDIVKIAGVAPDGIIVCEAAQLDYAAWQRMFERSAQKRSPIWASGTFESSHGWLPREWTDWQGPNRVNGKSFSLPTWANLASFPGGRQDPEILIQEATCTPEQFQERFGAVPCPPATLVFREFDTRKHVKKMTMAKNFAFVCQKEDGTTEKKQSFGPGDDIVEVELPWDEPVEVWIDPGYSHAFAVLAVMRIGDCAFVFDEVYERGKSSPQVLEICKARTWWRRVKFGVMDIAGRQHHTGESHDEIWNAKSGVPIEAGRVPIPDGIERHRGFLAAGPHGLPRLFHSPNCQGAIREYGLYKYRDVKDGRPVSELPIDSNNHCVIGDTLIDMPGGKQKIADLVGQEPYVYCCIDGKVAVRKAYDIKKTRENVSIVCVKMDKGEIYLTPDHPMMLSNGEYRMAGDLRAGDSLMAFNRRVTQDGYTRIAMTKQVPVPEHRFVCEEVHGSFPDGWHVHHIDGCCWNHHPDNLIAMSVEDHISVHHKGKVISDEQKETISKFHKERWANDDGTNLAIVRHNAEAAHEALKGWHPSEETRQRISESSKKMWEDPERREAARQQWLGREHTEEAKDKVRQAKIAYWQSEKGQEHKKRLAESNRQRRKDIGENHRVIVVLPAGVADVYDMKVEEAHNFVAQDVVIHNSLKAIAYGLVYDYGYVRRPKQADYLYVSPFSDFTAVKPNKEDWLPWALRD